MAFSVLEEVEGTLNAAQVERIGDRVVDTLLF